MDSSIIGNIERAQIDTIDATLEHITVLIGRLADPSYADERARLGVLQLRLTGDRTMLVAELPERALS